MVSEETRRLLRQSHPPDLGRWPADFRVRTAAGLGCYVDAKFHFGANRNVSIEMRSVLAARTQSVPWFYACAAWDGRVFSGFMSVNIAAMPLNRACCDNCLTLFHSSRDPVEVNARLPQYCLVARKQKGSGTPYFLVDPGSFPYGDALFDRQPWIDRTGRHDGCPLCYSDHASCEFASGSLACVKPGCANPHHPQVPTRLPRRQELMGAVVPRGRRIPLTPQGAGDPASGAGPVGSRWVVVELPSHRWGSARRRLAAAAPGRGKAGRRARHRGVVETPERRLPLPRLDEKKPEQNCRGKREKSGGRTTKTQAAGHVVTA